MDQVDRKFKTSLSESDIADIQERRVTLKDWITKLGTYVLLYKKEEAIMAIKHIREQLDDFGYWYLEEDLGEVQ